jgi:hypothetical protein
MAVCDWARKPHAARVRLALAAAAHGDPALDAFPEFGPATVCGLCSVLPQRHRIVDAIAGRLAAGEGPGALAEDYGLSATALRAVLTWMAKWPGAWQ